MGQPGVAPDHDGRRDHSLGMRTGRADAAKIVSAMTTDDILLDPGPVTVLRAGSHLAVAQFAAAGAMSGRPDRLRR